MKGASSTWVRTAMVRLFSLAVSISLASWSGGMGLKPTQEDIECVLVCSGRSVCVCVWVCWCVCVCEYICVFVCVSELVELTQRWFSLVVLEVDPRSGASGEPAGQNRPGMTTTINK